MGSALAQLESSRRKLPSNPFFLFSNDVRQTVDGGRSSEKNKKIAVMWAKLGDEEKQKYKDRFEVEKKAYLDWAASEEGRKILDERKDVLRKCKSIQAELDQATEASNEANLQNV